MSLKQTSKLLACAALAMTVSTGAVAAPFCAVFSYGKQCWYYSMQACQQAAGTSGACIVNDEEVKPPQGGAPFCVVQSYGTNCWYYDAQSCRDAAASSGGACVVNSR